MGDRQLLIVCGLGVEAAIARGPKVTAIAGGGDSPALTRRLETLAVPDVSAVVSFGLAGALDPTLTVGELVIADSVVTETGERFEAARGMREGWAAATRVSARTGEVLGVDRPILDPAAKAALRASTGAVALDMESHIAAAFARSRDLPFGALRIVSDDARRALPPVAGQAMRPDGSIDVPGVLASLARHPGQIPALLGTARDAAIALWALRRVRGLLRPGFALHL